jgi:hypothetical protein
MAGINIVFHKKKDSFPGKTPVPSGSSYNRWYGFWGMVTEVHPENNTVQVRTDAGRIVSNVRVASMTWVTIDQEKDYLSGNRSLPPVDTMVFCIMPNGEYSSAFVLCSGFSDDPLHGEFKEDSKDAQYIDKEIVNSGWTYIEDKRTGTKTIQNKPEDETIKIEVDQEEEGKEKVTVTIHGSIFKVDPETGIDIETDKDMTGKVKGNVDISTESDLAATVKGKADITADGDLSFTSKGKGVIDIGNAVATLGAMISDLLQALISFKSVGSPAAHTSPDLTAAATQIKAKWDQVFKK